MDVYNTQKRNAQLMDVQTALLDFARLSQRASSVDRQQAALTARILLERIMTLCAAQRGAMVLTHTTNITPLQRTPSDGIRVLAAKGTHEEEIQTLLEVTASSAEQDNVMDEYCWYRADLPLTGIQAKQPVVAVVLLGQSLTTSDPRNTIAEVAEPIIFLVEDAVKAVISTMQLAERAEELENTTHLEARIEIEQLKSELLNTMSHELRGPLASIKGYTATLLRYEKRLRREEQREFLEAIRDASDALSVIVDRLLEMAQFEADTIQLHVSPVDLLHLTREAIDAAQQSRLYTRATAARPDFFTFHLLAIDEQGLPAETLPPVWGDQRRLREVLDNILENAMKFSPNGGAITVTLQPVVSPAPEQTSNMQGAAPALSYRPEQPMLEITIQDQGEGIASEHLVRIFDRFQRVDTRLTREVNGLGLGLALCKCIVALHRGYVSAESQPGEGSTFHIWLPLAQTTHLQTTES